MDNKFFSWKRRTSLLVRLLAAVFCMSQLFLTGAPAMAAPGETITSPVLDVVPPAFLFEPEATFDSLKGVAQWNDWEQLLDNPYLVVLDPASPGNAQVG